MQVITWIPSISAILLPMAIPTGHMAVLWFYWQNYARFVDRRFCSCSCWDTVFKGTLTDIHSFNNFCLFWISREFAFLHHFKFICISFSVFFVQHPIGTYESGIASFKHFYFNATENTMKIWILTVIAIIALYECAKHLITLIIAKSIRYSMIFLFCLSIFSHYYAWWAYVNYYNDDFYSQWNHQMFFTVSEMFNL